jgi:hypothetical protein
VAARACRAPPISRYGAIPRPAIADTQVFCRPDHPLEITRVELPAGRRVTLPASSYAQIRQAVWVEKGELVIVESGERRVLGVGDCLGLRPALRGDLRQRDGARLRLCRRAGAELGMSEI